MTSIITLLKKIGHWLDEHFLFALCCFLIVFIPLYPKIPLWSPIEQYIVRIRLEDTGILFAAIVWFIQVLRGKAKWRSPMFWVVLVYEIIAAISCFVAMFVIKTVPLEPLHVEKTMLHFFRYIEYFSLYFVMYSSIKRKKDVILPLVLWVGTVLAISIYGYGQKYFYWPVYSTMNREFSKGIRLYLTEFARVQSTFGGSYDMAAYLVVALPIILAFAFWVKARKWKFLLQVIFWFGSWLLLLSASRTSFVMYVAGVAIVLLLNAILKKGILKKAGFLVSRGLMVGILMSLLFYYFGGDLSDRLNYVIKSIPAAEKVSQNFIDFRRKFISDKQLASIPLTPAQLNAALPKSKPPGGAISTDEVAAQIIATQQVASKSDQPPTPVATPKPTPTPTPKPVAGSGTQNGPVPADVLVNVPDIVQVATKSASGVITYHTVSKPRTYSDCALKKELSLCIREEVLWPRAIDGFKTNPFTGTGYATLTKESVDIFTEADSTDNNYLRTLGETGGLGFISFYGCVILALYFAVRNLNNEDQLLATLSVGLIGGTIGLLLNAIYIDVFASSKVAESFWLLYGLFFAYVAIDHRDHQANISQATEPKHLENNAKLSAKNSARKMKHVTRS